MTRVERDDAGGRDGRKLRRQRNVDAVLATVLEMLEGSETPTLKVIAERSGVTIRSIYRYFDDLDAAIEAARRHRVDEIIDYWRSLEPIDVQTPFARRAELVIGHRMRMERLGRPLRGDELIVSLTQEMDASVRAAFSPELRSVPAEHRDQAGFAAACLFRPRSIRAMLEPDADAERVASMISFALESIIDGARTRPVGPGDGAAQRALQSNSR